MIMKIRKEVNDMESKLKQARLEKGLTLEQAGEAMGVSKSALSRMERGDRFGSHANQLKASLFYKMPVDELFFNRN